MRRFPILSGAFLCASLVLLGGGETASAITTLPPAALNSHAATDADPDNNVAVATDGDGNWVAVWYSEHDLGGTLGTDGDILVSRSTDNGATWSAAAPLHSHFENDSGSDTHPVPIPTQGAGNWLVVWPSDDDLDDLGPSIGTDTDVLASRSTDNGATWSAPEPINNDAAIDGGDGDGWGLMAATDGAGTVVVTWSSGKNVGATIGADQDIIFARSTDDGVTWSDLEALNANADSDTGADMVYAPVATDGAGNWVAVWTSTEDLETTGDDDFDHFVATSSDGGATWSTPEYLHPDFKTDLRSEQFHGWLETDGAGTWIVVWMSQEHWGYPIDTDLEILFSRSTDNGATWTRPYPVSYAWADELPKDDYAPHLATDRAGNWLTTWNGRDQSGGPSGPDTDIWASRSTDGGVTWTYPVPVNTNAYSDSGQDGIGLGYPHYSAADGAGNWVVVWNSGENLGGTIGTDDDILYTTFAIRMVDSTADDGDFSTADGVCDTDDSAGDGPCTLRAAIEQANANPNLDNIEFDIDAATDPGCNAGTGVCTIQPASALPAITQPVAIDGYTQAGASANTNPLGSGSNAVLKIELDGTNAGASANGLTIAAGGSTIKGLVINRFSPDGIEIQTNGGNIIEGNFIGTDVGGSADLGNDDRGVHILYGAGDNTIGGSTAAARNLISGNDTGVYIQGSDGNTVAGNYLGTDITGTADLGNNFQGLLVASAANNTIGGSVAGEGNVISGNDGDGVAIQGTGADGNFVKGNTIGADATGLVALPNGPNSGVQISSGAQNNTVGGTTTPGSCDTDCNLISGGPRYGVMIYSSGTDGNTVSGNFIGVDATGLAALPNGWDGVWVASESSGNTIGGTAAGEENLIAFNGYNGVCVQQDTTAGNSIRGNAIHSNTRLGVDLVPTGQDCSTGTVTANDAGDVDTGPNELMNFPIITSASYDAVDTTISGTLDTIDPASATVDVYASDAADPSGYGEGRAYLGSTTAPGGSWTLVVSGPSPYLYLSATATDSSGNTSEFSPVPETDGDSDGVPDLYETNTGIFVSPTNTGSDPADADSDDDTLDDGAEVALGTDPNDPDSDDDGLSDDVELGLGTDPTDADSDDDGLEDGEEVALGTDPNDPDGDGDTICDGGGTGGGACTAGPDNCPFIPNAGQANSDGLPAGDACQCGDVNADLAVDALDTQIAREKLVGATLSGSFDAARCDFTGAGGSVCEIDDLFVLERVVGGASTPLENACPAYGGP